MVAQPALLLPLRSLRAPLPLGLAPPFAEAGRLYRPVTPIGVACLGCGARPASAEAR
jgi:hypothetical protein